MISSHPWFWLASPIRHDERLMDLGLPPWQCSPLGQRFRVAGPLRVTRFDPYGESMNESSISHAESYHLRRRKPSIMSWLMVVMNPSIDPDCWKVHGHHLQRIWSWDSEWTASRSIIYHRQGFWADVAMSDDDCSVTVQALNVEKQSGVAC